MRVCDTGGKTLFRGERTAAKCYECADCGRPIYKGEAHYCVVTLTCCPGGVREVTVRRTCCRKSRHG